MYIPVKEHVIRGDSNRLLRNIGIRREFIDKILPTSNPKAASYLQADRTNGRVCAVRIKQLDLAAKALRKALPADEYAALRKEMLALETNDLGTETRGGPWEAE